MSSSGHLTIGSALFGIEGEENLAFTIVVHVATVFSTLVILWKEIDWIFKGLFKWQMNEETRYGQKQKQVILDWRYVRCVGISVCCDCILFN